MYEKANQIPQFANIFTIKFANPKNKKLLIKFISKGKVDLIILMKLAAGENMSS